MEAVSLSPLPVASLLWQSRPGTWVLTVVCKATFELQPMESRLAPEQEPIHVTDRHWSDDTSWSLYAPTDLVPYRPRADVLLVGHAFAARGARVRSLVARIIVGDLDKAIKVHADRTFGQDGVLQDGPRFSKMPLLWERAGGGPETSNPVGMPPTARDIYGKRPVPNLQPPGVNVAESDDLVDPIGFGPLDPTWPTRRQRLNNHAATWSQADWHHHPLPPDFDASFFNAAPRDQQVSGLRDNERIILDNLHPEHAHLVTSLPGVHPRAFVDRPGQGYQEVGLRPDQLWINTDRCLVTLTWRGQVSLQQRNEAGKVLVVMENAGQSISWQEVQRQAAHAGIPIEGATDDPLDDIEELDPGLPEDTLPPTGAMTGGTTRGMIDGHRTRDASFARQLSPSILPFKAPQGQAPATPSPAVPAPSQRLSAMPFLPAGASPGQQPAVQHASLAMQPPMPVTDGSMTMVPALTPAPGSALPPGMGMSLGGQLSSDAALSPPPAPVAPVAAVPPGPASAIPPAPRSSGGNKLSAGGSIAPPPPPPLRPATVAPPPSVAANVPPPAVVAAPPGALPPGMPAPSGAAAPPPVVAPPAAVTAPPAVTPPPSIASSPAVAPPPLIRTPVMGAASAGVGGGVLASSNAAAGSTPTLSREEPAPASTKTPAVQATARSSPVSRDVLDLIWFDQPSVARFRKITVWRELLKEMAKKPVDKQLDDPGPGGDAANIEDRRDVFELLSRAGAIDALGVREALSDAVRDHGKFAPPLRLLEGELTFPFDEVELLKTTVAVVSPLMGTDETLKAAVTAAQDAQKGADLRNAPAVAESLTTRIREVWNAGKRATPAGYLETQTDRVLAGERHYQRRRVFSGRFIRAILQPFGPDELLPTYLPDAISDALPLFAKIKVRLIAEIHLQIDPNEAHSAALRVLAIARSMPLFLKGKS